MLEIFKVLLIPIETFFYFVYFWVFIFYLDISEICRTDPLIHEMGGILLIVVADYLGWIERETGVKLNLVHASSKAGSGVRIHSTLQISIVAADLLLEVLIKTEFEWSENEWKDQNYVGIPLVFFLNTYIEYGRTGPTPGKLSKSRKYHDIWYLFHLIYSASLDPFFSIYVV